MSIICSSTIKSIAFKIGFSDCGIAQACRLSEEEYPLDGWLAEGYNAEMEYMMHNSEMRRDPRLLVEGAKSVISLVLAYKPDRLMEGPFKIAQYAYGEDYHERMKRMLYQLIAAIKEQYPDFEGRPFVDTAPISDRHWAMRAGLGWIGHNNLFIHPTFGSFCFLGEIVTTSEVDHYSDNKASNNEHTCNDCMLCIEACPNHAIVKLQDGAYVVNARKCTSYNTIENRSEELPTELNTRGFIFGCDICQLACPYNKETPTSFSLSDERKNELESLPYADETLFNKFRKHSALARIKYWQLKRNIGY